MTACKFFYFSTGWLLDLSVFSSRVSGTRLNALRWIYKIYHRQSNYWSMGFIWRLISIFLFLSFLVIIYWTYMQHLPFCCTTKSWNWQFYSDGYFSGGRFIISRYWSGILWTRPLRFIFLQFFFSTTKIYPLKWPS